ncbi:Phosphorelay protein [Vibrio chagasii]|uniref:hypothetical protein n=1 Tax=Vibrio TaxID=662 RepID=UPI00076ACBB2|nr:MULTISPECIES: hypothetical protein [Vibrio]MCG9561343.1 Hpt domain-containing protein [Vibrio chagasii]MCG9673676.1 Hpt domain-containing protein [Vibrio chagasii]CAH6940370.1 Phosphorelay protein [Vibrio chagasii]CAH6952763.1 Phosphorelay protein [Vibrio chagasii]CAH6991225.1 Phosphorelay protein [Vibrio chagasii]
MYYLDEKAFLVTTGVSFRSKMGAKFRLSAVKSLRQLISDIDSNKEPNRQLAHRAKGIALNCGVAGIAGVCARLEYYDKAINQSVSRQVLIDICEIMINLCDI